MNEPTFERTFERTSRPILNECLAIGTTRGAEYADSWDISNLSSTFTEATLDRFGVKLEPEQIRLLLLAALIDVKDSRMGGPWKVDTIVDGINYRASYATLRQEYEDAHRVPRVPSTDRCVGYHPIVGSSADYYAGRAYEEK